MSVTYPADATATTYLFTLRGKVNTPTVADARELHNKTAGSADQGSGVFRTCPVLCGM